MYWAACFANFERILGFSVPSIILADLLGNKCLLVIGAFRSTLFVSVFQSSLLVIALFRAIVEQFSSNIFLIFLILVSWKNKAMSASCPLQKYHSSSRFPSLFLSSLDSFSVLFLRAKLGECVASSPLKGWKTNLKNASNYFPKKNKAIVSVWVGL